MGSRGSTIGAVAGGVIGAILGYFVGSPFQGAMLGSSLGMAVGSAVDPPGARMGNTQYKMQDVYYNTMAHNVPVPIVYGVNRVAGNLLWIGNINANVTTEGGGGKQGGSGGGGKNSSGGQQSVEVFGDFAVAVGEGEIMAVTEVFIGDKLVSETEGLTYTVYLGTEIQEVDPRLWKDLGALAPAFRNTAYIAMGGSLGNAPAIPQVNTEAVGKFTTPYSWGNPALIVQDILVHPRYGIDVSSTRIDPITFTAAYSYCVGMIPRSDITSAQAAALDRTFVAASCSMVNTAYNQPPYSPMASGTMLVTGLGAGYSVRFYYPDGTVHTQALADETGTAVMSWAESQETWPGEGYPPSSGYLMVYKDTAYTMVESLGRWPEAGYFDFLAGNLFLFTPSIPAYLYPRTADGLPGEQRFTLDYVVDNYRPVVEHLRDMLSAFGGFLTWSQGIVKLHIDRPGATVAQSFGMNEISADSFRWKRQSYRERPNVVRVQYIEPGVFTLTGSETSVAATLVSGSTYNVPLVASQKKEYKTYRQDFVDASDIWDIERTGERRERVLNLTGIKRRTQAQRMAQYYLNKAIFCQNACAFRVGVNALHAEVGDVVAVSHDIPRWAGKLFRIAEIQETENDELILGCLEHSEQIYSDKAPTIPGVVGNLYGQDTIYGTGGATGGAPTNVGRLSVYERPWENTLEIAYTRVATNDLFGGVDLYVQRGAGDFMAIGNAILSNAPTAYLTPAINTLTLVTSSDPSAWETGDPVTITGVPDGYAARLYHWYESLQAEAVASMGTVILPVNVTAPTNGYIRVYPSANSGDNYLLANHRIAWWPSGYDAAYRPGDLFALQRVPQVITPSQSWIPIERSLGGWTNGESLRIESEEIGYTTFTDSMLTGVTRGAHGTTAAYHTGVASLGMVAIQSVTDDAPLDLTIAFGDPLVNVEFFTQNSAVLYIGANSKFSAANFWFARNAAPMLGLAGDYSTGAGTWVSLMSSSFIPAQDTTSGMQWGGQVSWEPPGNWARSHKATPGGFDIGDATDRYYIRLTRVASLCTVTPTEMELILTNDVLAVIRKPSVFLYPLTLADSGQMLSFKAISRSIGGYSGDSVAAPIFVYNNS